MRVSLVLESTVRQTERRFQRTAEVGVIAISGVDENPLMKFFYNSIKFLYEVSRGEYRWYFLDSFRFGGD